jgi:DNA repair ATPase RecN
MEAKQLEQDAKNLAHEKKLEKTSNNMLDEIKRNNEHTKQSILKAVDNALEKTNVEVHNIQKQMTEIKSKNDSFASVIQYLEWKMQKDAQYNDDFLTKDEDMMI